MVKKLIIRYALNFEKNDNFGHKLSCVIIIKKDLTNIIQKERENVQH